MRQVKQSFKMLNSISQLLGTDQGNILDLKHGPGKTPARQKFLKIQYNLHHESIVLLETPFLEAEQSCDCYPVPLRFKFIH